jgi:hypothetical protein
LQIIGQVPNLAPNERYLPAADYGRVGALKLAQKIFSSKALEYLGATNSIFGRAGRYHFFTLGRRHNTAINEGQRAELTADPNYGTWFFPEHNEDIQTRGPISFAYVLEELTEVANIYGFNPSLVVGAFLTLVHKDILLLDPPATLNASEQSGFNSAKYNFQVLEALWGMGKTGYPMTYRADKHIASKQDYGGKGKRGKKGRKGKKKRRRYY